MDMHRVVKSLSHPMCTFLAEVGQSTALPSHFSAHTVRQVSFSRSTCAMIFAFFVCFLLVILLSEMACKYNVKALSNVTSTRRL